MRPAAALFARNSELWSELRKEIRTLVFSYAARLETPTAIVLSDALADTAYDRAMFDDSLRLAESRSARLISVVLDCDLAENVRRLQAPGRSERHKLTLPEVLLGLRERYELLRPDDVTRVDLDVTHLDATAAAEHLEFRLRAELD